MYNVGRFNLVGMTECGAALRRLGSGSKSMEETANRIVKYLHENFTDGSEGKSAFALARFFKTHPSAELEPTLQDFASKLVKAPTISPSTLCLTLLATAGDKPEWNDRRQSNGHQAIPLLSEQMVASVPMISNLIRQFGVQVSTVLKPDPKLIMDLTQKTFNVFHVPEAPGSPFIPSQNEFVIPCGIKSVLGFGGMLPSGNLFAVILFSKAPISSEMAELFKPLALSVKMAVLPYEDCVFAGA